MSALAALLLLAAAPARVVSLNLCTDEYLLLLARPGQIASISRLGADPQETPLAARAAGLATNNGHLVDVLGQSPDLVLSMGHDPQAQALARRLGLRLVALPYPGRVGEVTQQVRQVAELLGTVPKGEAFVAEVRQLVTNAAPSPIPAQMVGGGGLAPAMEGLAADWLRLAGLRQRAGGPVALEALVADPPPVLLINRYRPGQQSLPQAWTRHPALARLPSRRIAADGRAFLCGGAAMPAEIRRLKAALAK